MVMLMTEEEAERGGIDDYDAYCERIQARNPSLMGECATVKLS